jgi:hypothetical protein
MSHVYESDKRITDVCWNNALVGKTIERTWIGGTTVFIAFTDGAFVYGTDTTGILGDCSDGIDIDYKAPLSIREAHDYGLIQDDDPRYVAWKAEQA